MSDLLIHPASHAAADGTILDVTPASAGWSYVGFEVLTLMPGVVAERDTREREACVVVVSGTVAIVSRHGEFADLGGRTDPWSGPPDAAYLPPGTAFSVEALGGPAEVGLCWAPVLDGGAAPARVLPGAEIAVETRGYGALERTVSPDPDGRPRGRVAARLRSAHPAAATGPAIRRTSTIATTRPRETLLEETYYHRIARPRASHSSASTPRTVRWTRRLTLGDRDCVLVPRGYHTVSAPPGYDLYYLNVMAGPVRHWAVANDPDHEWTLTR